jgi:hypothetical protein
VKKDAQPTTATSDLTSPKGEGPNIQQLALSPGPASPLPQLEGGSSQESSFEGSDDGEDYQSSSEDDSDKSSSSSDGDAWNKKIKEDTIE